MRLGEVVSTALRCTLLNSSISAQHSRHTFNRVQGRGQLAGYPISLITHYFLCRAGIAPDTVRFTTAEVAACTPIRPRSTVRHSSAVATDWQRHTGQPFRCGVGHRQRVPVPLLATGAVGAGEASQGSGGDGEDRPGLDIDRRPSSLTHRFTSGARRRSQQGRLRVGSRVHPGRARPAHSGRCAARFLQPARLCGPCRGRGRDRRTAGQGGVEADPARSAPGTAPSRGSSRVVSLRSPSVRMWRLGVRPCASDRAGSRRPHMRRADHRTRPVHRRSTAHTLASSSCGRCQSPARFPSSSRRWQVVPDPNPQLLGARTLTGPPCPARTEAPAGSCGRPSANGPGNAERARALEAAARSRPAGQMHKNERVPPYRARACGPPLASRD